MNRLERQLAEQHRQLQLRLSAATTIQVVSLWPLLDVEDLAGSTQGWLAAVLRLLESQHAQSSALARRYVRAVRTRRLGSAPGGTLPVPGFPAEAARTSLAVTGPVRIERARRRGLDLAAAVDVARTETARAASRHVANGGRETVAEFARMDPRAGFARVASGNACDFCQLLESRGAVYSARTVDFEAHDGCNCSGALEYR